MLLIKIIMYANDILEPKEILKYETAGHPISGLKWTRKATEKMAQQLKSLGIEVRSNTVCRLLKDMGFSLRVNSKKIELFCPAGAG